MKAQHRKPRQQHWLAQPESIRRLWLVFVVVLALTLAAELGMDSHGYFGIDAMFGFNAWYGFLTCVAMIVFAKILGNVLKRGDDFYDE